MPYSFDRGATKDRCLRLASLERATDFVFCFVRGRRRRRSVPRKIEHTGDWSRSCNDNQYSDLFDLFIIGRRSDRAKRQRALFPRGINDEDGNCVHRTNVSALFFSISQYLFPFDLLCPSAVHRHSTLFAISKPMKLIYSTCTRSEGGERPVHN